MSISARNANKKVKLREVNSPQIQLTFDVTPDVTEAQTVNYKSFDPTHAPGSILSYIGTPSRTFSVSGIKLLSRTQKEADTTKETLNLLRSWTKPVFGSYEGKGEKGEVTARSNAYLANNEHILGAPPRVLLFSAYSAGQTKFGLITTIPVVITSLNFAYPSDVDYIPATDGTPVPIMMSIDISLTETHAPSEYSKFSIAKYRDGTLLGF